MSGHQQPLGEAESIEEALQILRKMKPPLYHEIITSSIDSSEEEPPRIDPNDYECMNQVLEDEGRLLTLIFCPVPEMPLLSAGPRRLDTDELLHALRVTRESIIIGIHTKDQPPV